MRRYMKQIERIDFENVHRLNEKTIILKHFIFKYFF